MTNLIICKGLLIKTGYPSQSAGSALLFSMYIKYLTRRTLHDLIRKGWYFAKGCFWLFKYIESICHYIDVTMGAIPSQNTSLTIIYSIVYSDADQRKHQSSASLAFVRGIHRSTVNSPHKWPVTRKMFPFDDVIMYFLDRPLLVAASLNVTPSARTRNEVTGYTWYCQQKQR